jgi:RNA polymerase sigma-32 factor
MIGEALVVHKDDTKKNYPVIKTEQMPAPASPLQAYMREIGRYPLLSPEEEYELGVAHFESQSKEAAQRLITSNLRLVVKIANEFRASSMAPLDLIQEGNYGLMLAVKRFNPYKGVKLSSYSSWWIRAYILKFLMDNQGPVRLGTTAAQRKLFYNLRKETEKLLREYETADVKMLASNLGVREKDVVSMQLRLNAKDVSFDAPLPDGSGRTQGDVLNVETMAKGADDVLADSEVLEIFEEHLNEFKVTLKGRDLDVFNARLMSETPLTLQEIGDRYGISRERARQIEARIMKSLKDFVRKKGTLIELMDDHSLTTIDA